MPTFCIYNLVPGTFSLMLIMLKSFVNIAYEYSKYFEAKMATC